MNGFQDNVLHLSCPRLARDKTTIGIRREAAGWASVGQLSTGPESIENEFEHRGMEGTHCEHSFEYSNGGVMVEVLVQEARYAFIGVHVAMLGQRPPIVASGVERPLLFLFLLQHHQCV